MSQYYSADEIKTILSAHLTHASAQYDKMADNAKSLSIFLLYNHQVELPRPDDTFIRALEGAVVSLLPRYNVAGRGIHTLDIGDINDLYVTLYPETTNGDPIAGKSMSDYCQHFLQGYDFKGLAAHLETLANALPFKGLSMAANALITMMNVGLTKGEMDRPSATKDGLVFQIKMRKEFYDIPAEPPRYNDFSLMSLRRYCNAAKQFQGSENHLGLFESLTDLEQRLIAAQRHGLIPDGTVINLAGCATAKALPEAFAIHIPVNVARDLLDFCSNSGTTPMWHTEQA